MSDIYEFPEGENRQEGESRPDPEYYIEFKTPYKFEGREYNGIDLSGIKDLTIRDVAEIQRGLLGSGEQMATILLEASSTFTQLLAAKATGRPIEFFKYMPLPKIKTLKRSILRFLRGEKGIENHVIEFEEPYCFQGERYTGIDLGGIADLCALDESAVENQMARVGAFAEDNNLSYYYACFIAARATGKPADFFLGLPLVELIKLKNAVNDPDFLG